MPSRRAVLLQAAGALALLGAGPADEGSLAGQLLIAAPTMGDPRFVHTVILMLRHDKTGAFGIILNRPLGEETIASLLQAAGDKHSAVKGSIMVFAGGPVQPELGFVVHSAEYRLADTLEVDGKVAMTASTQILRDIGHGKGPAKRLFAFGYSGWGAGQLEGEMGRHGWYLAPEDPALVFDDDRSGLWDDAMARRTREL
jgi:putative transcriptional regulator